MKANEKKHKFLALQKNVRELLETLNYDLKDPDIKDTPKRVAKLLLSELGTQPTKKLFQAFPSDYGSMITLVGHRAYSRCPHHLERVIMDINIAYIPNGKLLGLSKLGRIADYYSAGLMLQEEIAEMISTGLNESLQPLGVAVNIIAKHMCMSSRGLKSHNAVVTTTRLLGLFKEDHKAREEFFEMIKISNSMRGL